MLYMHKQFLSVIRKQVYASGQSLLINGNSEFYKIIYNTNNVLDNGLGTPLGIDNNGGVGRLNDLPYQFQLNYPILESGLLQADASLPITYNENDILFKQDTLLTSALDNQEGALWNSIKLADISGAMNFYTNFVNGLFKFYNVNGATPAFVIDKDGSIGTATITTSVGSPGHTAGDVDVPNGAGILSNIAGSYGAFQPQDISGHTYIRNSWTSGQIRIFTSGGVLANQSESIVIWPEGEVTMQNGDTHNYNPIARLALNSTSQGFLLPRMSTENRNTMGFVVGFNFSSGGSGYTSVPSVSFSGGGGSGAIGTVTMSGSEVSGITITNPGTGYTNAPTVSFSGGGGSGAAATVILSLDTNIGLQIFNTDTNCVEYWNGSTWISLVGLIIDTTATPYTKSTINTAYPNATIGFKVVADSAGFTYIKKDNNSSGNWNVIASSQLT